MIKQIYYVITTSEKTLHIFETYDAASNVAPDSIDIPGEQQGEYFDVYISNFEERPTVEWLLEFGIKEYGETPAA